MRILVLGGDGFCGWPGGPPPVPARPRRRNRRQSVASSIDEELGDGLADSHPHPGGTARGVDGGHGADDRLPRGRHQPGLRRVRRPAVPDPPGGGRPLRGAAGRAVLDEVAHPQAVHDRQQRERDAQRAGGDRRIRSRRAPGPPRHDGCLRLRHGGHADPRGLPRREGSGRGSGRERDGRAHRPDDALPDEPRLDLPHDEGPRPAPLRVLREERQAADHGPPPGHHLGHATRRRPSSTSASSTASTTTATTARSSTASSCRRLSAIR